MVGTVVKVVVLFIVRLLKVMACVPLIVPVLVKITVPVPAVNVAPVLLVSVPVPAKLSVPAPTVRVAPLLLVNEPPVAMFNTPVLDQLKVPLLVNVVVVKLSEFTVRLTVPAFTIEVAEKVAPLELKVIPELTVIVPGLVGAPETIML